MTDQAKDILNFWDSIEKFTPCTIETDNRKKTYPVKSIQSELSGNNDLPWLNKHRFKHFATHDKTWVYTVFFGVVKIDKNTKITKKI